MKISRWLLIVALLGGAALAPAAAEARHRYHHHYRPSVSVYWGPGWGWYDPWWYYGSGPYWGGYTRVYPNDAQGGYGALDLDVSPERAEVWVDGERIGVADDFDGFPSFLWLPKGTYDVAFYLPGYTTLARQYSIYSGLVIDVEDALERGETVHPTDLGPKTHERRDARLRADEERRQEVERRLAEQEGAWEAEAEPGGEPAETEEEALDARAEPGRLVLHVEPDDASVYLDGRFLGTGRELSRLRSGLIVDPGAHRIEVVRPGRQSEEVAFEVESGRDSEVTVELEEE